MDRPIDQVTKSTAIDTCSVWNVLSSIQLHRACVGDGFHFVLTEFCLYECLIKPRKAKTANEQALQDRLRNARTRGQFASYSLSVDDLQEVVTLEQRRCLGRGELASIAFAKRSNIGFQTDDMKARRLAETVLTAERVQTTSLVLGYLFFTGRLSDSDLSGIIDEHENSGRPLRPHFEAIYQEAMRCRLMARTKRQQ